MSGDVVERLRAACDGHPHAVIEWPHRILHEAADLIASQAAEIAQLTKERDEALLCQQKIAAGSDRSAIVARIIIAKNEAENRAEAAEQQVRKYREAVTPSANTKADYIGEFQFTVTMMELDESDEPYECQRMVTVPWTTIKEIMAAISARTLTNGGENGR